jgi:hypothetical protein
MYCTKLFVMEAICEYRVQYQLTNVIRLPSVSNEVSFTRWISENDVFNHSCKTIYRKTILSVGLFIRSKMRLRFSKIERCISPIRENHSETLPERPVVDHLPLHHANIGTHLVT